VITLEILATLERQFSGTTDQGYAFRLGDFFDYVAGTSIGTIIAAALAIGMSTGELLDLFRLWTADVRKKLPFGAAKELFTKESCSRRCSRKSSMPVEVSLLSLKLCR
jgi:patatin-like phospholipase/acyl hydrolase